MTASAPDPAEAPRIAEAPYPGPGTVGYTVGVLTMGWIIAYIDRYILSILIEPMRLALKMSDTQLSLVQGFAFALFFCLAGLPIGRLVDRANRRNILLFGTVCWSIATFACGLAGDFWQLFAARLAVGVGEACLAPASFSMVADLVRRERRGAAMGVLVSGTAIGNASSIFLGGMVLQAFGASGGANLPLIGWAASWQLVFFTVATPGLLLALFLLTLREPARREKANEVADPGYFTRYFRQHWAGFVLTFATFTANMIGSIAIASWIAVVLMRVHHMAPAQIGATIGAILLTVGAIAPPLGGWLGDWLNRRFPAVGRLGTPLVVYPLSAALTLVWWFQDSAAYAILVFGLTGPLIGGFINGACYPAMNQLVPNELRGQTMTLYLLVANLIGFGVAPTAVALVTDRVFHDPSMVTRSVVLVAVPAFTAGFLLTLLALKPYRRTCEAALAEIAH